MCICYLVFVGFMMFKGTRQSGQIKSRRKRQKHMYVCMFYGSIKTEEGSRSRAGGICLFVF